MRAKLLTGLLILAILSPGAQAATTELSYPEMSVVPRATDRLASELPTESLRVWTSTLPMLISGTATLAGALVCFGPGQVTPVVTGLTIGGGWVIAGLVTGLFYRPYEAANQEISAVAKGGLDEKITRERLAEEAIDRAGGYFNRIRFLSAATNVFASVPMIVSAFTGSNSGTPNYLYLGAGAGVAAVALIPLFIKPYFTKVADEQESFKQRIFSPVASATMLLEPGTGRLVPGAVVAFHF
ncbi:MAG: hypothetical protein ACXVCH_18625 [Bdellovibrionota bacterium]